MTVQVSGSKRIADRLLIRCWVIAAFIALAIVHTDPTTAAPLAGPSGTCGSSSTIICIDPATQTIGKNQVTTVDIRIDNVTNLYGADVTLSYNQFVLCAQDASHSCPNSTQVQLTPGPLLTSAGVGKYFIQSDYADNSTGTIGFALIELNPAPPVSGSGVLATVTFVGLGGPQSQIHFTYSKLATRDGFQIPATTQDGVITVNAPTAVVLSSFNLDERNPTSRAITLDWKTASEIRTAGFNIYRSNQADGPYSRLNLQLIPASSDAVSGGAYQYQDVNVTPGQTYYYQLEDVELNGVSTRHKPVVVNVPAGSDTRINTFLILGLGLVGLTLFVGGGWRFVRDKRRWQSV